MYSAALLLLLAGAYTASAALQLDFGAASSIKAAAKDVSFDVMTYYKGNQSGEIIGLLSNAPPNGEYYWWTGSVLWSTMLDYWYYTGDDTYNAVARDGLVWQSGPSLGHPFLPINWTANAGNDDQGLWAMVAMQAVEMNFLSAPKDKPSWIELARAVFEMQAARWSSEDRCNGGLRWQLFPTNMGYNYKNTMSNAVFLNLGARLFRYTDNQTYAEWSEKTWQWLSDVGLIDRDFNVFDGTDADTNCTQINKMQPSYAPGVLLQAAAYMYNHTTGTARSTWQSRLSALTNRTLSVFFGDGTLTEVPCEHSDGKTICTTDMRFFKGITLRSLASTAQLAPFLRETIVSWALRPVAKAAVESCKGGVRDRECGFRWPGGDRDEKLTGVSEEMNALSALLGLLVDEAGHKALASNAAGQPVNSTGGTSGGSGGQGSGNGAGSGPTGTADGSSQGRGGGNSAGTMRVAMGTLLAGLFAALL